MISASETPTHATRIPHETELHTHEVHTQQRPLDRVRWPAVIAGLFGTLSILAVLTVLGVAIGLSSVDRDSDARNFGIGAGIWGGLATLIAFAVGGYIAAGTAALRGRSNALIQGATVWMVTVGLLVYLIAGGVGAMFNKAADASTAVAQGAAANPTITNPQNVDPNANAQNNPAAASAQNAGQSIQNAARDAQNRITPEKVEETAEQSAKGAWGTFGALILGLGAALAGSYFGARDTHSHHIETAATHGHAHTA